MPRPALRSRSLRKISVKLPSGRSATHYERRKNSEAVCAMCKRPLRGVPTNGVNKLSKTKKRPQRMFGGYLCHSCLEKLIKSSLRGNS
ncbi:MAG: 50S ribosomal protein L34e [Candidatus Aramenus sp.]|jgi:large subunit ribosomal protein L34e|nr:50S ribosomal protein L34e [Candidatus Aramenus sp.]